MKTSNKKNVGVVSLKSGVSFRVWAPNADQVYLIGTFNDWQKQLMKNEMDGYWHLFIKNAQIGQEYKYIIENGDKVITHNDPRSFYCTTASGASVITNRNFDWGDDKYINPNANEQIIYELHIGTFNREDLSINGDFESAIKKLDYLQELGVTTIELMPISTMAMDRGWGYGIDYIYSVESLYGGHYGFKKFIKEAHRRNMGVVLDVVYNHLGPDTSLDLWQFDGWNENNYGGIYFYNDWRAETPWGNTRPDYGRPEIHQYFIDNVRYLIHDFRLDGLRVDSTLYIRNVAGHDGDPSNDLAEGWELLQKINKVSKAINPNAITIAEDNGRNDYITKTQDDGGAGFSTQWDLEFSSLLKNLLSTDQTDKINFSGLDFELGRKINDDGFQRVIFIDSHDSAANGSSRFIETISPKINNSLFARKQALIAATIIMTIPGIPMIFQGQEILEGGSFNDWQGINWKLAEKNSSVVEAYKQLIKLRKNSLNVSKGLTGQNFSILNFDDSNKVLAYRRWENGGANDDTVIIINFSNKSFDNYSLNFPSDGEWKLAFCSTDKQYIKESKVDINKTIIVEHGSANLIMPASTAMIFHH